MSYRFSIGSDTIAIDTQHPEDAGPVVVTETGNTLSRLLATSYGASGHLISLASTTANDIDAALHQSGMAFSLIRSQGTAAIAYPHTKL